MRTLFLHCGDCGLDIELRAASPEGEQRISGGFNCPACLVPLAFETRAEQGSGVEGAGGEPPRRCICGHDGCGYTTCPDCPTHGDEWPKSFKHRVAPAALGSRPSVITAKDAEAAKAYRINELKRLIAHHPPECVCVWCEEFGRLGAAQ